MNRYRIEFSSTGRGGEDKLAMQVPDIPTALIVAEINMTGGSAQLWDGERRIAEIQRQPGTRSAFWRVS
ncbi:hypothetical protein GCM10009127_27350 [Alteraurantiacibacter aestuarii]|uniref:Uncharacterized protein n=1 Tax=Alteraurantiacibacter aestuarii TaxID=650004 RepID=A0A844ZM02_9SPHN|nr:hypothetical protein [Alteraurantiacibacter aestuarii]MXO88845.1 hypothetical protein [Alteraurantiacibacter aestuarii]